MEPSQSPSPLSLNAASPDLLSPKVYPCSSVWEAVEELKANPSKPFTNIEMVLIRLKPNVPWDYLREQDCSEIRKRVANLKFQLTDERRQHFDWEGDKGIYLDGKLFKFQKASDALEFATKSSKTFLLDKLEGYIKQMDAMVEGPARTPKS